MYILQCVSSFPYSMIPRFPGLPDSYDKADLISVLSSISSMHNCSLPASQEKFACMRCVHWLEWYLLWCCCSACIVFLWLMYRVVLCIVCWEEVQYCSHSNWVVEVEFVYILQSGFLVCVFLCVFLYKFIINIITITKPGTSPFSPFLIAQWICVYEHVINTVPR